ncbi:MAG: hypothetical protein U0X91_05995 [Spirosomataceae bacterium]
MLRILLLTLFFGGLAAQASAQIEDYYRPQKRYTNPVLINHPDLVTTDNHWYLGIEGGGKWNGVTLSNNLSGLLAYKKGVVDSYAGAHLGYSHNLRWSIETGYIRNPSNLTLFVNATRPFPFTVNDLQHTIPMRFKWRVFRLGNVLKKSGMYVGGGFLWTPTRQRKEIDGFQLGGLTRASGSRTKLDTIIVENQSFTTGRAKIELEGSLEFVGRVGQHFELVSYGRVSYAGASALESRSELFLNNYSQSISFAALRPVSYHFGVAVRYLYGLRNSYRSRFEE